MVRARPIASDERPKTRRPDAAPGDTRWILPATIIASSLGFIDGSVVNVGLPAIQTAFATSLASVQWVVNGYMLTLASLILLGGSASDRFGLRLIFLVGLAGFVAASLCCAVAASVLWLVAARFAQGAAAAVLTPASLAIIAAAYRGEERGAAIGSWAAAGALTTAFGPPLGGFLIDTLGWRSIFLLNPPIGTAAFLLGLKLPRDAGTSGAAPLDWQGALLGVGTLAGLSFGLIALGEGRRSTGAASLALAIALSWLFLRIEARSAEPMMPLALFRDRMFSGINALTVFLYAALSAALFVLPFVLIKVHGYGAAQAGAAFLPLSLVLGTGSRWAGRLVVRWGPRRPLVLGPSLAGIGYGVLAAFAGEASFWRGVLPGLLVVAVGMTLSVAPSTTTVFEAAPEARGGAASGINNAAARVGSLIAIAALGLAFGAGDQALGRPEDVLGAARVVMLAAVVLSALSALTALVTIGPRRG